MQTIAYPQTRSQATDSKSNTDLTLAFRLLDDISQRHALQIAATLGGEPGRIIEAGYGIPTPAFSKALGVGSIRRRSLIIPCRDSHGQIVALHDQSLNWLTGPAVPHIANAPRARYAEIRLCETTPQADTVSLSENVCAVARNGCGDREVEAAVLSALRLGKADNPDTIKRAETVRTLARAA